MVGTHSQAFHETGVCWNALEGYSGSHGNSFSEDPTIIHYQLPITLLLSPSSPPRLPRWVSGKEPSVNAGDTGDAGSSP